jgi:hypothetical protein
MVSLLERKERHTALFAHALLAFDRIADVCKLLEADVVDSRLGPRPPEGWPIPDSVGWGLAILETTKATRRALEQSQSREFDWMRDGSGRLGK